MEIEKILKKIPPAPGDVTKWINDKVIDNTYIIYNKKEDKAICTRCGHTFRASRFEIMHNGKGVCPRCKSEAIYKASGKGRGNLTEYFRVLIFTHKGNTVYGTLTEVTAEFIEPGKPQLSKWLSAVYVFSKDEQSYYKHSPSWWFGFDNWEKRKYVKLPPPPSGNGLFATLRYEKTVLYEKNMENVFKNSFLKYNWLPNLFSSVPYNPYHYIKYISLCQKYQSIELLAKAGFTKIVNAKVCEIDGSGCVNWRGKDLQKILRLPKGHIRRIRQYNPNYNELMTFQGLSEKNKRLPWKTIQWLGSTKNIGAIEEYIDIIKWCTWAANNKVSGYDWVDYIRDCKRTGLDIRKKSVLFPDDFQTVHRELAMKIKEKDNAEKNEKIKAIAETFSLELESDNLMLKIAESQTELNTESSALCHCVKSYGDKVANGKTLIYFIRRKDAPDTPYYTLEIKPSGTFIQCRGKFNCGMTDEIEKFKDMVVAEFNKKIKGIKNTAKKAGRSAA